MMAAELMQMVDSTENMGGSVSLSRYAEAVRAGRVQEVQTTSDFAHLADLVDRGVKQGYLNDMVPITWETLGWRRDAADFRPVRDYEINAARIIPAVAEKGEYLPIDPELSSYEFTLRKYGCQWDLTWEAWLSDQRDLSLLGDYPASWGLSARYTREYLFTASWAANTTLFTAPQGNLIDDPLDLDGDGLAAGITAIRNFTDPAGNVSVYPGPLFLVVPPALEYNARRLVDSTGMSGAAADVATNNPLYGAATVIVNPFLPVVDTGGNADTTWYLFASPRIRPAVRYGYLRGYENPEIWVKDSDARAMMNSSDDPFAGSFATDDIAFKLRFTFGTGLVDWRGALMSDGTG